MKGKYKLDLFNTLLNDIEQNIWETVSERKIVSGGNIEYILTVTLGKCITIAREISILCEKGFPDGAMALSRNLYEQFITIAYIENCVADKEQLLKRYWDSIIIQELKCKQFEAENLLGSAEIVSQCEREIAEYKEKYKLEKYNDYWWTGKSNFYEMYKAVLPLDEEMKPIIQLAHNLYKRACVTIHASGLGNISRIGGEHGYDVIDMGPWEKGQESVLYITTFTLSYIVGCTFFCFGIKYENINKRVNELMIYYNSLRNERLSCNE